MPLRLDPSYIPEREAGESGGNVRMLDHERRRVINTFVTIGGLHRHGSALGIDGNVIDGDVPSHLMHLLDPVLAEASNFYDECLEPKPQFLVIEREGVRIRQPGHQ